MKICIIGAGPAGIIAAITAAKEGHEVKILEKNRTPLKKMLITGKGRCNITNDMEISKFSENIVTNSKFMYGAFSEYTNKDVIELLKKNGLGVKVERGARVFPVTDKSISVVEALMNEISKYSNISISYSSKVDNLEATDGGIEVHVNGQKMLFNKCILATGGKSYPLTGSTGDGYVLAEKLGHEIKEVVPALVPFNIYGASDFKNLQGLTLKNINLSVYIDNTKLFEEFGELLFTHFGISGPTVLRVSSKLYEKAFKYLKKKKQEDFENVKHIMLEEAFSKKQIYVDIDMKPGITEEQLDKRIQREILEDGKKDVGNILKNLLPQNIIGNVLKKAGIEEDKKGNVLSKEERANLVKNIKRFKMELLGYRDIKEAIITKGGVSVKQINPKTMQSKIVKGLYFAGEIIDVDGLTGGFNLQIAYSTGNLAGKLKE